jgi:hypothetical protein
MAFAVFVIWMGISAVFALTACEVAVQIVILRSYEELPATDHLRVR